MRPEPIEPSTLLSRPLYRWSRHRAARQGTRLLPNVPLTGGTSIHLSACAFSTNATSSRYRSAVIGRHHEQGRPGTTTSISQIETEPHSSQTTSKAPGHHLRPNRGVCSVNQPLYEPVSPSAHHCLTCQRGK